MRVGGWVAGCNDEVMHGKFGGRLGFRAVERTHREAADRWNIWTSE